MSVKRDRFSASPIFPCAVQRVCMQETFFQASAARNNFQFICLLLCLFFLLWIKEYHMRLTKYGVEIRDDYTRFGTNPRWVVICSRPHQTLLTLNFCSTVCIYLLRCGTVRENVLLKRSPLVTSPAGCFGALTSFPGACAVSMLSKTYAHAQIGVALLIHYHMKHAVWNW